MDFYDFGLCGLNFALADLKSPPQTGGSKITNYYGLYIPEGGGILADQIRNLKTI